MKSYDVDYSRFETYRAIINQGRYTPRGFELPGRLVGDDYDTYLYFSDRLAASEYVFKYLMGIVS